MDINTGRLVLLPEELSPGEARRLFGSASMEPVPPHLEADAMRALGGRREAYVNLKGGSPLARHARARRKAKRKEARAARRRNRR